MTSTKRPLGPYDALAFIEKPQYIYAAINSERSYTDSETGESGLLVTFALMTKQMVEKQQELHAWANDGAPRNSVPELTPYLFALDAFIPNSDHQLRDRYLELRRRTTGSDHPLPNSEMDADLDVVILSDSQYFSCSLSLKEAIRSSDYFLELKGVLGLSFGTYYVEDAILSVENPGGLTLLDASITNPIILRSSGSGSGTASTNGSASSNGSIPPDVDPLIRDFLSDFDPCSPDDYRMIARIYYAGQANLIVAGRAEDASQQTPYWHNICNPAVFIDIGRPIRANWNQMTKDDQDCVQESLNQVKDISAKYAFITHWDEDHYNAAYDLLNDQGNSFDPAIWFLPTIQQCPHLASNLISKLNLDMKTIIPMNQVPLPRYSQVSPDAKTTALYKGTGTGKNPGSYILKLGNTIFPGDCLYRFWPQDIFAQVNNTLINLVVPHHGSRLSKKDKSTLDTISSKNGTAIVSVGGVLQSGRRPYSKLRKDGTYSTGLPNPDHLEYLIQRNFNVGCTYGLLNTNFKYKKLYLN